MSQRRNDLLVGYAAGVTAGVAFGLTFATFDIFESIRQGRLIFLRDRAGFGEAAINVSTTADTSLASAPQDDKPQNVLALQDTLQLLALPADLLGRILSQLSIPELAYCAAVSRDFRDGLVQQALAVLTPSLTGVSRRTQPNSPVDVWNAWASSHASLSPARREMVAPSGPEALSVRRLAQRAAELAVDAALLDGRLMAGEYHFLVCTCDDEGSHAYEAYGSLRLSPDGTCRGSALEAAPDGLQATFTRNGTWRPGTGGGIADALAVGSLDPQMPGEASGANPAFRDARRAFIFFDYDYAGSLYEYRLLAARCLLPHPSGHSVGGLGAGIVLPPGTKHYGPQLHLVGRWAKCGEQMRMWTPSNERGRIKMCRLWRAEWAYALLPDDPHAIERRLDLQHETAEQGEHDVMTE